MLSVFLLCLCLLQQGETVQLWAKELDLDDAPHFNYSLFAADSLIAYEISDAETHVKVTVDNDRLIIINCQFISTSNISGVADFLLQANVEQWAELIQTCSDHKRFHTLVLRKDEPQVEVHNWRTRYKRRVSRPAIKSTIRPTYMPPGDKLANLFIYNGTLWCGTGNKASSFDDLGVHKQADECCRAHDYCPYSIDMFTKKYNYNNNRPYTLSGCECDYHFYRCLKDAGTDAADFIGNMFFSNLGVPCFNVEYGRYCTDSGILTFLTCTNYELGMTAKLNYVLTDIWKEDNKLSLPQP